MPLLIGTDEAGYGPTLGPLVGTGVAFRVPNDRIDTCLWHALRDTCTRTVRKRAHKLVVADSKKLYKPKQTMMPLERAALVCRDNTIRVADLPEQFRGGATTSGSPASLESLPADIVALDWKQAREAILRHTERAYLDAILREVDGLGEMNEVTQRLLGALGAEV